MRSSSHPFFWSPFVNNLPTATNQRNSDTDLLHKYVIRAAGHVSALDAFKAMYKVGDPLVWGLVGEGGGVAWCGLAFLNGRLIRRHFSHDVSQGGVPAVALVDDDARLFGVLSASDLRNLNKSNYQSLNQVCQAMLDSSPCCSLNNNQPAT